MQINGRSTLKLLDAKSNYLTSKLNERFEISIVRAKLKTKRNIKRERQTNLYVEKKRGVKKKKGKKKYGRKKRGEGEGRGCDILKQKTTNRKGTKFVATSFFFLSLSPSLFSFYPGEVNLFRAARPDRNHLRGGGIDTHGR